MPSIFTKIVNGEIPCFKVAEDEKHLAFLDISPLTKGHTLVIPKTETDYLFDLDDAAYSDLMLFCKKISDAIKKSQDCKRIAMSVIGLEVPHAHVHLIPIQSMQDCNFSKPKLHLSNEEFVAIAKAIASQF